MLGVPSGLVPLFGFRPEIPLRNGRTDRTEIDMKLGDLMVEAKPHGDGFSNGARKNDCEVSGRKFSIRES